MAKAAGKNKSGRREASRKIATRPVPNWPLLALALMGMALAGYLTVTYWRGQALAGCPTGSGCDIVLNSRWAKLFGVPTSLWGFLAYSTLAGVSWIKDPGPHWKASWVVSLFGVLYSAYLTSISVIELGAACPYCLASAALFAVILVTVAYQRPKHLPKFSWGPWLAKTLVSGAVFVVVLHLVSGGIGGKDVGPEDPELRALAEHLKKVDARFYGASWCPHCTDQKEMFGASAARLPYVECSPQGPRGPLASACESSRIQSYPTWIINGRRHEGVLPPSELAKLSGFKGNAP